MIIGNGLLAKAFSPYFLDSSEILIFASGVSNSSENLSVEFERERILLSQTIKEYPSSILVYFSTCSIRDLDIQSTQYVKHKIAMEILVEGAASYFIFRLPQVVGSTPNPHTLTNFLHKRILGNHHFKIWRHARRNLIDIEDIVKIATHIIKNFQPGKIVNIANTKSISIIDIVSIFENILNKSARYEVIDAGGSYDIDTSLVSVFASQLGIDFGSQYCNRLIEKYYGK
jgi:nucleoside-diphosphate-sugar epimerase